MKTATRMSGEMMSGMSTMPSMMGMPMMGMNGNLMQGAMGGMAGAMVPRCSMKMETTANGMKCTMTCDDKTAAEMMKNLCIMNAGGMITMCCMMNGMMCCCHNMGTMGMCKVGMMDMGCTMTCTSGDAMCAKMIMANCECMMACMASGCSCVMMMNSMPMCCSIMA